ncbi:MAG: hypothetical protein IT385_08080 [Deltaproteobacteria bacterium]|nr:hypothetical protein [Deltaproteobacteria bacterium]
MRSLLASRLAPLLALLAACADPSGGTTAVDCAKIPTAPACRPDVTTTSDATFGTDATPGPCTTGARQCAGNVPELCQNGGWVALAACANDETCTNGNCVETNTNPDCCADMECGTDCGVSCGTCTGQTVCEAGQCVPQTTCVPTCGTNECGPNGCGGSCGTCALGESCDAGQCVGGNVTCTCNGAVCGEDNCGNSCGSCSDTQTCIGGQCQTTSAGADGCSAMIDCVYGATGCIDIEDEEEFNACAEACYAAGSTMGQAEFDAYLTCANGCADDRCFVQSCSDEQAACFFDKQGAGTCLGIFDCFDTCADGDGDCIFGCYEAATTVAQAALIGLNNCLDLECPDITDPEDPCFDTAIAGFCAQFANACVAN